MVELLPKIAELWRNDRNKILDSADRITRHVAALRKPFLPEKVVLFRPMDKHAAKEITAL